MGKDLERSFPNRDNPEICLERLQKIRNDLSHDTQTQHLLFGALGKRLDTLRGNAEDLLADNTLRNNDIGDNRNMARITM
jgi:hypothetical protein